MTDTEKPSIAEQLEKLEALRANGSLTDDEFRNLKSVMILKELQLNSPRKVTPQVADELQKPADAFYRNASQDSVTPPTNAKSRALILGASLVVATIIVIFIASRSGSGSQQSDTPTQQQADAASAADANVSPVPSDEAKFIDAVTSARSAYNSAPNDMAKGGTRADRRNGVCQALQGSRSVDGWIGTIKSLSSNGDGKGVLAISVADDVVIGTWNNALSDVESGTLMDQASPVFKAASAMKEGDKIQFSGTFIPSEVDCVTESSLTLEGSMQSPDFVMRFVSVSVPSASAPRTQSSPAPADSSNTQTPVSAAPTPSDSSQSPTQSTQSGTRPPTDQSTGVSASEAIPPPQIPAQAKSPGHWYYCDPAKAYYPYVKLCPIPWRAVTPNSSITANAGAGSVEATGAPANLEPPSAQSSGDAQ